MTDPTEGAPTPQPPMPQAPAPPPQAPGDWGGPPPPAQPAQPAAGYQVPPQFQPIAAETGPAPGILYADLTSRIIAFVIDAILLGIVAAFVIIALGAIFLGTLLNGNFFVALIAGVVLAVANMVVSAIYFVWGWTNPAMRASLGQRALGLQTLSAADGATLTREQATRRWAFLYGFVALASALQLVLSNSSLGGLASLIGLVAFGYTIYLLWTTSKSAKRQGYHDVQAGTVVVKRVA